MPRPYFQFDDATLACIARYASISPITHGEAQCTDQNALAAPGFAGDHREALAQLEVELLDQ